MVHWQQPLDGGEDVVGALGPAERLRLGVVGVDLSSDGGLEFGGEAVRASPDAPSFSSAKNRSTWLIQEAEVGV